ncbi:MAG TPA: FAD-binding oxidoreductase [Steroidobacteraceae bacterium]|nr:FAD-binding oxidoreductase [Steroidobacteraceae bacterium]
MPSDHLYPDGFVESLLGLLGEKGVRQGEAVLALDPGAHPQNLRARLMARPSSAAEVARVLELCREARVGVVPQGGRTGLAGGAVTREGQLIVSLDRMNHIQRIDPPARTAVVEAGVTLQRLQEALRPHGLVPGIDLGARGSATIGGMVSTNAGGIDAFRYGTMRERVLGLEVALADGRLLEQLSRVRKDNAGLALRQLFIGAEGTLGIVTRVALALVPDPGAQQALLILTDGLGAAVRVLRAVEATPRLALAAAELMSGNHFTVTARALGLAQLAATAPAAFAVLLVVSGADGQSSLEALLAEASERGELIDVLVPRNSSEERDLWRVREDWAVDRVRPGGLWYDVSVPLDALAGYLAALGERLRRHDPGLDLYVVGHLADGNLHVTVNAATPISARYAEIALLVYEGLREVGGSFSAEHGIGLEKRAALEHWAGPTAIELMRAIKTVFDPSGIMNPGKVLRA